MTDYNPDVGETVETEVGPESAGLRLDAFLADLLPAQSRSFLKRLIADELVSVDGEAAKPSRRLGGGEAIRLFLPEIVELTARPEPLPLRVLYEDRDLIVVDKPPGQVVHPSPGHERGSLANALLHHCGTLSTIGAPLRPGIVHRLDRDTSGVMVAARHDAAHEALAAQFAERTTTKIYDALVHGRPPADEGTVEAPIGRHPRHPVLMAALPEGRGRPAQTAYELREALGPCSRVECRPRTGRTHQIRVHLDRLGCPILCDAYYGRERRLTRAELTGRGRGQSGATGSELVLERQALHARSLSLEHPRTGERLTWEAELPADLAAVLRLLRRAARPDER